VILTIIDNHKKKYVWDHVWHPIHQILFEN